MAPVTEPGRVHTLQCVATAFIIRQSKVTSLICPKLCDNPSVWPQL